MPFPTSGGGTCVTRANTYSNIVKTKLEEEVKKQPESLVKDPNSAIDFLVNSDLKSEDNDMSFELLSAIAMQLLQQPRSPKSASDAFKALAYLILDLHQKHIVADITDSIAKAVRMAMRRIWDQLVEAMDQLVLVVAETTETSIQLKTECQETINNFKGAMKEVAATIMEGKRTTNGGQSKGGKERGEETTQSYVDRVRKGIPITHTVMIFLSFLLYLFMRLSLFLLSMTHKPQGLLPLLFPHCLTQPSTAL